MFDLTYYRSTRYNINFNVNFTIKPAPYCLVLQINRLYICPLKLKTETLSSMQRYGMPHENVYNSWQDFVLLVDVVG